MNDPTDNAGNDSPGGDATIRVQQLFVRHQGIVKAFILSLQPGFADAEDVLQETFLVVTRRAADFREGTNFVAWACSIARFKLMEARRKVSAPAISEEAIAAVCEDAPDEGFFQERLPVLRECLRRLAPRAREMVWLRYHGELGLQEIAGRLAWKEPAVRVALSKARVFLRACMERGLTEARP